MGVINDLKLNKRERVLIVECLLSSQRFEEQMVRIMDRGLENEEVDKESKDTFKVVRKKSLKKAERLQKLLEKIHSSYV